MISVGFQIPSVTLPRSNPLWWPSNALSAFDFVNRRYMVDGAATSEGSALSLTRASIGTALNSSGEIESFASGDLRFVDRGLLLEEARTNLLSYSEDLTQSVWNKQNTSLGTPVTGPTGITNAYPIIASATSNQEYNLNREPTTNENQIGIFSLFLKKDNPTDWAYLQLTNDDSKGARLFIDLANGVLGSEDPFNTGVVARTGLVEYDNDFLRVQFGVQIQATSVFTRIELGPAEADLDRFYSPADTTNAQLIVAGLQYEEVPIVGQPTDPQDDFISSYIPTGASTVTRAADQLVLEIPNGTYDIVVTREGAANDNLEDVVVTGGNGYTVPVDMSNPYTEAVYVYPQGTL